jgi:hypothetical protein
MIIRCDNPNYHCGFSVWHVKRQIVNALAMLAQEIVQKAGAHV